MQGQAQLRALHSVFPLKKIQAFDTDESRAKKFAKALADELKIESEPVRDLEDAIRKADICVTCTPSRQFFVRKEIVAPGTFIAAVGADDEHKQEIDPALLASSKVVADSLAQCSTIGELHHAIRQGLMRKEDAYAELSEIVAGRKEGRTTADEVIIFDSTGVATEDAIVAVTVYEKARTAMIGDYFKFAA
jgi:ornithine cyclodeaminase/alanine dehydrogenase-like protein (mu-crystallin family)